MFGFSFLYLPLHTSGWLTSEASWLWFVKQLHSAFNPHFHFCRMFLFTCFSSFALVDFQSVTTEIATTLRFSLQFCCVQWSWWSFTYRDRNAIHSLSLFLFLYVSSESCFMFYFVSSGSHFFALQHLYLSKKRNLYIEFLVSSLTSK